MQPAGQLRAQTAISGALHNDMTLQTTIARLRTMDMRAEALRAPGEVKRLRVLAADHAAGAVSDC